MTNVLTLNGITVIGNPTQQYQVATGVDFGEIVPDTTTISSLLLDGDIVSGDRTGNRTWNMTILVKSTASPPTRVDLSAAIDNLLSALNVDTFPVTWTPTGCPTSVVQTRGRPTIQSVKQLSENDATYASVTLTFETLPFLLSSTPQSVSVAPSGGAASLQVDGMNTGTFTNGTLNTTTKYEGAGSMSTTLSKGSGPAAHFYYIGGVSTTSAGRAITSVNLSTYVAASLRIEVNATLVPAPLTFNAQLVLSSSGGSATWNVIASLSIANGDTSFQIIYFDLTATPIATTGTLNLAAVTGWQVFPSGQFTGTPASQPSTITAIFDDLRVYPSGSVSGSTTEGTVWNIPSVLGSARTPISLGVTRPSAGTFTNVVLHSPPTSQDPDLAILVGLISGTATVAAANMNYNGTYSVLGVLTTSASGARTVTATFTQKIGATTIATQTLTVPITGTLTLVPLGQIALPLAAIPPESNGGSLVIALSSAGDTWADVVLCDTEGQTILITGLGSTTEAVFVDAPTALQSIGPIYQSTTDRTAAFNAMNLALPNGGPILFEPGNNKIVAVSSSGAPGLAIGYTPAYLDEAQQ